MHPEKHTHNKILNSAALSAFIAAFLELGLVHIFSVLRPDSNLKPDLTLSDLAFTYVILALVLFIVNLACGYVYLYYRIKNPLISFTLSAMVGTLVGTLVFGAFFLRGFECGEYDSCPTGDRFFVAETLFIGPIVSAPSCALTWFLCRRSKRLTP